MDDDNKEKTDIGSEYNALLERSDELFLILRDMPRYGLRQWQTHFMKTFDVFTKLWKFQHEHRKTLQKEVQLKRYQIGEIASKIGQLYYHYYLYTSDIKYLYEAMDFYSAILSRNYFKLTDNRDNNQRDIKVRCLRYLARYFVIGLLLKDQQLMSTILNSLQNEKNSIPEEISINRDDWNSVLKEGSNFMDLDNIVTIVNAQDEIVYVQQRLVFKQISEAKGLKLRNAVLIGSCEKQLKFSELTIDMFRMIQLIEYLPLKRTEEEIINMSYLSSNPCKHLLYKPLFGQINAFLSAIYKDLPEDGVLMIYISNDETKANTENKKNMFATKQFEKHQKDKFYPEDIAPFTRKPLFIIVDIEKSDVYQSIPSSFHEPQICLMAPTKVPEHVKSKKYGSIFTLFLFEPLFAICQLCRVLKLDEAKWKDCQQMINKVGQASIEMLLEEKIDVIDPFGKLLSDPFLHNIMAHFFLCLFIFRLYKDSQGVSFLPTCSPPIPSNILNHKVLHRYVLDILSILDVRDLFFEHMALPQI